MEKNSKMMVLIMKSMYGEVSSYFLKDGLDDSHG